MTKRKNRSHEEFALPEHNEEQPDNEVLSNAVKDASSYTTVKTPGPLQPTHLFPPFSGELVLLSLPNTVNPLDLVNCEMTIGGKKDSGMEAGGHKYRVKTNPTNGDSSILPSLFLPSDNGQLMKVPVKISACVRVRAELDVKEEGERQCIDIDALRSVHYDIPTEVQRRDFFSSSKIKKVNEVKKPGKGKKKSVGGRNTELDCSQEESQESDKSPRKKKKKKKHASPDPGETSSKLSHTELGGSLKKKIKKEPE